MTHQQSTSTDYTSTYTDGRLVIIVPAEYRAWEIPPLIGTLIILLIMIINLLIKLSTDGSYRVGAFALVLSILILVGLIIIYKVVWQLWGDEIIEVSDDRLRVTLWILNYIRTREYRVEQITGLRVEANWYGVRIRQSYVTYPITFRYGGRSIWLIDDSCNDRPIQVLNEILEHFPAYGELLKHRTPITYDDTHIRIQATRDK